MSLKTEFKRLKTCHSTSYYSKCFKILNQYTNCNDVTHIIVEYMNNREWLEEMIQTLKYYKKVEHQLNNSLLEYIKMADKWQWMLRGRIYEVYYQRKKVYIHFMVRYEVYTLLEGYYYCPIYGKVFIRLMMEPSMDMRIFSEEMQQELEITSRRYYGFEWRLRENTYCKP